ncbi:MAG: caspase family protein [Elusimicrobia bacterium]|nr:caspase family protein [Elusimicrobiota bacterium]
MSTDGIITQEGVRAVALSHSGEYLAAGAKDGTITIWDAANRRIVSAARGHKEAVTSLSFSPSGALLASASLDSTIGIWSVPDGKRIRTLSGHSNSVNSVSFSRSDDELVSASSDKTVRIWRASDGSVVRVLRGNTGEVYSAAFSPGGDTVASAGEDETVRLWRTRDGAPLWKARTGLMNVQYALAFSPTGQLIASAGEDSRIQYRRAVDGGAARTSQSGGGAVLSLSFSRSGEQLISAGKDGAVRAWRVSDAELLKQFDGHAGATGSVAVPSESGLVASAGEDGTIRLWTLPRTGNPSREWGATPIVETDLPVSTTEQALIDAELDKLPDYRTPRRNAYAVIIGLERYRDLIGAEYASRDAILIRKYFEKALGIPPEHILLRQNERATLGDLKSYFETWLKEKVSADAEVFVYYAGHGTPNPKTGESSIVPYDALPEAMDDGYPLKRLYAVLGALPAKRVLVILDSCFSGTGGPRTVLAQGARPIMPVVEDQVLSSGKVAVISAASGSQISGTHRVARHGLLTYHMIRGLRGEAAKKDGTVSLIDLYSYLLPKVVVDARNSHREQEPKLLPPVSIADPWNGETLSILK